jgi:hypothetical protein
MSDTLIAAIVGAVAGIITGSIGSLFAPWANWGIEKQKQKLAHRRELVAKWREMVAETSKQTGVNAELYIHSHKDYYSLLPHLRKEGIKARTEAIRAVSVKPYPILPILMLILEDIDRIEREWDLV